MVKEFITHSGKFREVKLPKKSTKKKKQKLRKMKKLNVSKTVSYKILQFFSVCFSFFARFCYICPAIGYRNLLMLAAALINGLQKYYDLFKLSDETACTAINSYNFSRVDNFSSCFSVPSAPR